MAGYYDRDRNPRTDAGVSGTRTMAGSMNHPAAHYGNTAEFMVSGWPYFETISVTNGAGGTASFEMVTQWVCISAIGTDVTVTIDGGAAAFTVPSGTISPRFDFKCTSITVVGGGSGSACIAAGLTNVSTDDFPNISTYDGVA